MGKNKYGKGFQNKGIAQKSGRSRAGGATIIIFPIIFLVIGRKSLVSLSIRDDASMVDINRNNASLMIFDLFSYLFLETNLLINLLRFSFNETEIIGDMGAGTSYLMP